MPSETRITQYTSSSVHGLSFCFAVFPTPLLAYLDPSQSHILLVGYSQMSPSFNLINSLGGIQVLGFDSLFDDHIKKFPTSVELKNSSSLAKLPAV